MSEQEYQDPDDIFRDIDLDNQDDVEEENIRLVKKRKAYRSNFTLSINSIANQITASRFQNGAVNRSQANRESLKRAREKLEVRYERLQALNSRQLEITQDEAEGETTVNNVTYAAREAGYYQGNIDAAAERYNQIIRDLAQLDEALQPQPNWNDNNHNEHHNHLKPIIALKPEYTLSFDNTPTELNTWSISFRSYFDASKFDTLPVVQQQAFLRQGLKPDVWTAIKHKINDDTPVFSNPLALEEDSCQKFIENAFQIRYPLIMRRYKFFTYERKGNQTVTNFRAKLRELAAAAQLEQMGQNDYLIFRMIAGINDSHTADKLLSIPQADFNLEEVERVALTCEAAKNYSIISPDTVKNQAHIVNKISVRKDLKKPQYQDFKQLTGPSKIEAMIDQGLCIRCTLPMHKADEKCPHLKTECFHCGVTGHLKKACSKNPLLTSETVNQQMVTYDFKPDEWRIP